MPTYQQTLSGAQAGTLTAEQFIAFWATESFIASQSRLTQEIESIVAVLQKTEPNQKWWKNDISIVNGQVAVTTGLAPGPSSAIPGVGGPDILSPLSNANPLSWAQSLVKFLGALMDPHTWIRVAEFLAGAILLAVGVNAALKQGIGPGAPQIKAPKTGFQYAAGKAFK